MITYNKGCFGFWLLLRITGTTWPGALAPGFLAAGISIFLGLYDETDVVMRNRDGFLGHPYAFQLFAVVVGLLVAFKTQSAYSRYWEAAGALQNMASKWLDGVGMAIAFDAAGDASCPYLYGESWERSAEEIPGNKGGPDHQRYVAQLVHIASLLHAVALQDLRRDHDLDNLVPAKARLSRPPPLPSTSWFSERSIFSEEHLSASNRNAKIPVLGGLKAQERHVLSKDTTGQPLSTAARVAMVEGWFMRRVLARQKFEQGETSKTAPPILSRLYQVRRLGGTPSMDTSSSHSTPTSFTMVSRVFIPYNTAANSLAFGMGAAEQIAYDHVQKYAYAISEQGVLNVIDWNDPSNPQVNSALAYDFQGAKLTDIEICAEKGLMFIGSGASDKTQPGTVHVLSTVDRSSPAAPMSRGSLTAGPLPDMILPNSDCTKLAVGNEGEGDYDTSLVDPAGSVMIFENSDWTDLTSTVKHTVTLDSYTDAELMANGVHLPLPLDAMAYWDDQSIFASSLDFSAARATYSSAMNLEPEYLAWSADDSTLFVNLQENNAIATITVPTSGAPSLASITGLGLKDYGDWEEKLKLKDLVDSDGTPDSDMLGMTISADAASAALAVHAPTTCGSLSAPLPSTTPTPQLRRFSTLWPLAVVASPSTNTPPAVCP
ncbi:Alkaline phosphatase [Durusdinium trenchii]|uniref:Alkaline phosphatase n=1 Tax=Durusdinium trenchii TaxID=1381693 RepID=A0ABP0PGD0_9DINO